MLPIKIRAYFPNCRTVSPREIFANRLKIFTAMRQMRDKNKLPPILSNSFFLFSRYHYFLCYRTSAELLVYELNSFTSAPVVNKLRPMTGTYPRKMNIQPSTRTNSTNNCSLDTHVKFQRAKCSVKKIQSPLTNPSSPTIWLHLTHASSYLYPPEIPRSRGGP